MNEYFGELWRRNTSTIGEPWVFLEGIVTQANSAGKALDNLKYQEMLMRVGSVEIRNFNKVS